MSDIPITKSNDLNNWSDHAQVQKDTLEIQVGSSNAANWGDTLGAIAPTDSRYQFWVDWNNDGTFTGEDEYITDDVIEADWSYGRDYASQLTGNSTAGTCRILLKNNTGKYNSFNTASSLYGSLLPGRRVQILMETDGGESVMWQGFLETIQPQPTIHRVHRAELRATGPFGLISQRKVNVPMQTSVTTGNAVGVLLNEIGWPGVDRDIDTGVVTMTRWWTGGEITTVTALRSIEDTEGGFIRENKLGQIAFENRSHRTSSPHDTSQVTFSDAAGNYKYFSIGQADPIKEIFNIIEADVRFFTVGAVEVLWTSPDAPAIPKEETKSYWANFPNSDSVKNAVAVDAWTTPVAGVDWSANTAADGGGGNLTAFVDLVVTKKDTEMEFAFTNNHTVVAAYITPFQARGTPVTEDDTVTVKSTSPTSQAKYGERTYPIENHFLPDIATAETYTDYIRDKYKDPIPIIFLEYSAFTNTDLMEEARIRDVSDRITIVSDGASELGINDDFFVERISHRVFDNGLSHTVRYECSQA